MNKPKVTIRNGNQLKCPSRAARMPAITQEYTVTNVTAERVAISHLETTSRASHSFLSSILISCHEALRHILKLIFIISPFDDIKLYYSFVKYDTISWRIKFVTISLLEQVCHNQNKIIFLR